MPRNEEHLILILGGFLSRPSFYKEMKDQIESLSGQEVRIVDVRPWQWLSVSWPRGWIPILKRLERTITASQVAKSPRPVTLIGHSLGGVLGYQYLIVSQARGDQFKRHSSIRHLVTLGSPHHNQRRWLYGGLVAREVEQWAAKNAPPKNVMITCIAGKSIRGQAGGSLQNKRAFSIYQKIGGDGNVWGDGIIPVPAALLPQAKYIVLEGVRHYARSGGLWYGSSGAVNLWWPKIWNDDSRF